MRLGSEDGSVAFRNMVFDGARDNLEKDEHVSTICLVVARRDLATGQELDNPQMIMVSPDGSMGDPGQRDAFADAIADVTVRSRAMAAALVVEAWTVVGDRRRTAMALRWREEHGSLAFFPGRVEQVRVTWEHVATGAEQWAAPIIRNGSSTVCGPFVREPHGLWLGRFASLLSTESYGVPGAEA